MCELVTMANINQQLTGIYYSLGDAGSYGGVEQLYNRARERIPSITREQVRKFLNEQVTYQLHKPAQDVYAQPDHCGSPRRSVAG